MAQHVYLHTLWIDTESRVLGDPSKDNFFLVSLPLEINGEPTRVIDLLEELRNNRPAPFETIGIFDTVIWKLREPKPMGYFTKRRATRSQANVVPTADLEEIQLFVRNFDLEANAIKLRLEHALKDHFSARTPIEGLVHIIVQLPAARTPSKRGRDEEEPNEERPTKFSKLDSRRAAYIEAAAKAVKKFEPSSLHAAEQLSPYFLGGRPVMRAGFNAAIYHKTLAILREDLQTLDLTGADARHIIGTANREEVDLAYKFCTDVVEFAEDETQRLDPLLPFFWKLCFGEDSYNEGHFNWLGVAWGLPPYAIMEVKPENGCGGDASLQGVKSYIESCQLFLQRNPASFALTNLPAIIIGIMGNVLEISIAVTPDIIHCNEILRLKIVGGDDFDRTILNLIVVASMLKKCALELKREYESLDHPASAVKSKHHLPSITITSPNEITFELDFKSKLSRSSDGAPVIPSDLAYARSLFLADLHPKNSSAPPVEVVVKFSATYNEDAHKLLANELHTEIGESIQDNSNEVTGSIRTLAPKLYGCHSFLGGGNLNVVVMDRVKGRKMFDHNPKTLPQSVFDDIKEAIDVLHARGYVFGDLRADNIMISDDTKHAKLVDFDWAAKEGEGRYPPTINRDLINSELRYDVYGLGPMLTGHDTWAFDRLHERYCSVA